MKVVVGILALGMVNAQPAPTPKFEVASIKPCTGGDAGGRRAGGHGGTSPGRLNLPCLTVRALVERTYVNWAGGRLHVWPEQIAIEGGPAWINSERYRIEAKADGLQSQGTMNGSMLQALLGDRFKLKIHREARQVPVYVLSVAKGGARLDAFREGSCLVVEFDKLPPPPAPGQPEPVLCGMSEVTEKGYRLYRTTMAEFATEFAARLDRPVIDKTGIAGMFNIQLELTETELYPARSDAAADPSAVFDAVRTAVKKLGLRLDPAKGPGEFLVIDQVERPSEN
jgi:uncharacterized protein (TIGR03435 family)